jgi:predicted dehydrogenase
MDTIRFVTLNPGHFHAALVQKEMYPQVDRRVHVYAPLGPDLVAHMQRIAGFNTRAADPTRWELEVHACDDPVERLRREKPGNVVVLAGRNAAKIDAILAALDAGLHVLADKPWILTPDDLPKLREALDLAEAKGLVAYDIMTERHEITSLLQRELVQDEATFGSVVAGSPDQPGVFMESVHYLKKLVAGQPLRRPAWFFDASQQGEALSDVGTHLVDLVAWALFPGKPVEPADLCLFAAQRWPTMIARAGFEQITGEKDFPASVRDQIQDDQLACHCNTRVNYALRGVHVKLNVLWDFEAAPGAGDTHLSVFRGSHSRVEVRQGREEHYQPELYVFPNSMMDLPRVQHGLHRKIQQLQSRWPGVELVSLDTHFKVSIPPRYRVGHEAHFAEVTHQFLRYLRKEESVPAWEKPNMLAKYTVTTQGVEMSRKQAR